MNADNTSIVGIQPPDCEEYISVVSASSPWWFGHRAKRREEAASYVLVEATISFGGGSGEGSGT